MWLWSCHAGMACKKRPALCRMFPTGIPSILVSGAGGTYRPPNCVALHCHLSAKECEAVPRRHTGQTRQWFPLIYSWQAAPDAVTEGLPSQPKRGRHGMPINVSPETAAIHILETRIFLKPKKRSRRKKGVPPTTPLEFKGGGIPRHPPSKLRSHKIPLEINGVDMKRVQRFYPHALLYLPTRTLRSPT